MLAKVSQDGDKRKLYACEAGTFKNGQQLRMSLKNLENILFEIQVRRHHQFERRTGGGFDSQEFDEHPERYI